MDNEVTDIESLLKAQQQPSVSKGQSGLMPSSGHRLRECLCAVDVLSGSEDRIDRGREKRVRVLQSHAMAETLAGMTSSIDKLSCNVAAVDQHVAAQGLQLEQHASQLQLLCCKDMPFQLTPAHGPPALSTLPSSLRLYSMLRICLLSR